MPLQIRQSAAAALSYTSTKLLPPGGMNQWAEEPYEVCRRISEVEVWQAGGLERERRFMNAVKVAKRGKREADDSLTKGK